MAVGKQFCNHDVETVVIGCKKVAGGQATEQEFGGQVSVCVPKRWCRAPVWNDALRFTASGDQVGAGGDVFVVLALLLREWIVSPGYFKTWDELGR